jgi:ribosomal protein S18 acetylase RimI-like enzyme
MLEMRRAQAADTDELRAIAAEAYAKYTPRIGRTAGPVTADYAGAIGRNEVWVAVADGDIAGMLVLVAQPDHLSLENIAVRPSAQGSGVGSALLELADREAARLGLNEIRLYTNITMTENQAWYPRHGYTETHRGEQDGYQRVFYARRVPG